ncbi:outer membrane protein assembly factor BamE [Massilia sp. S19_KUP03_FR1]|uniref:outer membrane protein assembly factor BamE n=1 Tax=Massilia sp. S19_KUP03_FR1 TaxID=3025503 RepID=UPI002FCDDEE2
MHVKQSISPRFHARAALVAGLTVATLTLSGCAALRDTSPLATAASQDAIARDAEKSAATANAGAQTTKVTNLQKFLWVFTPYRPDVQQGNFVSQEMIEQVKVGQTREQIMFILGTPLLQDVFHKDRWDYPFYLARGNGELTTSRVTLYFKDDKLERFDGGNLPSEREYIARIAGPSRVKEQIAPPADAPPKSTLPQK